MRAQYRAIVVMIGCWLFAPVLAQESGQIQEIRLLSSERIELRIAGPVGQTHILETSPDLEVWSTLVQRDSLTVPSNGVWTVEFTLDSGESSRFYRAVFVAAGNSNLLTELPGDPQAVANDVLPDLAMPEELDGEVTVVAGILPASLAHILVVLNDDTTVGEFNDLLASEGLAIAGSIPVMRVLLLRRDSVTTIDDLALQMETLSQSGLCEAVAPNLGFSLPYDDPPASAPSASALKPMVAGEVNLDVNWTWDAPPLGTGTGGNNAFELSRIPQMWNWLDYGHRQKAEHGGHKITVMEFAYFRGHEDSPLNLTYDAPTNASAPPLNHGIGVLGVVGAARDNGTGIQGVTPLASSIHAVAWGRNTTGRPPYESARIQQLSSVLCAADPPKVINISSGINWNTNNPATTVMTPATGETGAQWMDRLGNLWRSAFRHLNALCFSEYLIVCSAGNDSGVDARYNSPMANVACRQDLNAVVPNFLTVENVMSNRVTSARSNLDWVGANDSPGDSVSAGGTDVGLLGGANASDYRVSGGTSYASPLVCGLASYLWTLDPDLTVRELKLLLINPATTLTVPGGANLVDGFAATLGIDLLRGDAALHRALVDVDDGTLDGNLRQGVMYFSEDPNQIHTADGRRGDGRVNMRDFRVFRDAWLQVIGETEHLDGGPTHFKKDLNFDGVVNGQTVSPPHPAPYVIVPSGAASAPEEKILSRYDFNGNGLLDEETDVYFAPTNALSPFKIDPDTPVLEERIRPGILRDLDVLLSEEVWEQDEENVLLDSAGVPSGDPAPYFELPPEHWTTNTFLQFDLTTSSLPYLWSFDLHLDMEAGDPVNGAQIETSYGGDVILDGFWIDSIPRFRKARLGEWEGVVTVPFPSPEDLYSVSLPPDFPFVGLYYKRTVGEEFHQYVIHFRPEPGEDVGLSVGFDEFQFYSNTRGDGPGLPGAYGDLPSVETIAKAPGAEPYTTFFLPGGQFDELETAARDAAVTGLAGRLRTPDYLPGSPELEPIYTWENELPGVTVRVYGLEAIYRPSP